MLKQVLVCLEESKQQRMGRKRHSQGQAAAKLARKEQLLGQVRVCAASQVGSPENAAIPLACKNRVH